MSELQENLQEILRQKNAYLLPENLKKDVTLLGVTGTFEGGSTINNQDKTINPTTSQQSITADSGYTGLGTVTVNAVTSSIDNNITAGNIKKDVSILGVTGTYEGGSSLPYTELEYIESSGTQNIDTQILSADDIEFEMKLRATSCTAQYCMPIGGGNSVYVTNAIGVMWRRDNNSYQKQGQFNNQYLSVNFSTDYMNIDTILTFKNYIYTWDDGTNINTISMTNANTFLGSNIYLFAGSYNNNAYLPMQGMKLYYCKIWKAGTLVRDLIPVKRNSNDEICLYDKVSRTYFTNQGTGTFTAGPVVDNPNIVDTSDADATASDILSGKTAYVQGNKITGTYEVPLEEKDVNFYDYDGTLLYSYSASDFVNLSAMPTNPTHTGLTSQGWNWSLSDAKTYVSNYEKLNIGQMYITNDDKTRIYVTLDEISLSFYIGFAVNGTATIDWGDGTTDTATGTDTTTMIYTKHTYSSVGDYVISLSSTNDIYIIGTSSGSRLLNYIAEGSSSPNATKSRTFLGTINKIEFGSHLVIGDYAFAICINLKTITIPNNISSTGTDAFNFCVDLKHITLPIGITTINANTFYNCMNLNTIAMPNGITTIGNSAFWQCSNIKVLTFPASLLSIGNSCFNACYNLEYSFYPPTGASYNGNYGLEKVNILNNTTTLASQCLRNCYKLKNIKIPASITNIGTQAFFNCTSMQYYDFTASISIPTISSSTFSNIPDDCKIIVPDSLYADWIVAQYWSNYANNIVKESEA